MESNVSAAAPFASSFGSLKEAAAPDGAGEQNFDPDGEEHRWGLRNSGAVRQPFPDVCMCLTMIWYMTDGNERTGGTCGLCPVVIGTTETPEGHTTA